MLRNGGLRAIRAMGDLVLQVSSLVTFSEIQWFKFENEIHARYEHLHRDHPAAVGWRG